MATNDFKVAEALLAFDRLNEHLEARRRLLTKVGIWICPYAVRFHVPQARYSFRLASSADIEHAMRADQVQWLGEIESSDLFHIFSTAVKFYGETLKRYEAKIERAEATMLWMREQFTKGRSNWAS